MTSKIAISYQPTHSDDDQIEDGTDDESVDADTASGDTDAESVDADSAVDDVAMSDEVDDTAADADGESFGDEEEEDALNTEQSTGSLATVISGILRKKPTKHKVILAKAKTDKRILAAKRKQEDIDAETNEDDVKDGSIKQARKTPADHKSESDQREERLKLLEAVILQKKAWENLNRLKPEATDKEQEHKLQRIATKGVIQLFNAVKKQQKMVEEKLKEAGSSVRRRDTALQTMTKGKFLDVLRNTTTNVKIEPVTADNPTDVVVKTEEEEEDDPKWSILREDFMMGANMKDWDKEEDEGKDNDNDVE